MHLKSELRLKVQERRGCETLCRNRYLGCFLFCDFCVTVEKGVCRMSDIFDYLKEKKPVLVKITKKKYADDLLRGLIYLNPIHIYQSIEDCGKEMKKDHYEGANYAIQSTEFDYLVSPNDPNIKIPSSSVIGAVWGGFEKNKNYKIYCMYNIKIDFNNASFQPIDKKITDFGDTFVMIKNPSEFVSRIDMALEKIREKMNGRSPASA